MSKQDCRHKLTWQVRPQEAWATCDKCEMRVVDVPSRVFVEITRIGRDEKAAEVSEVLKGLLQP